MIPKTRCAAWLLIVPLITLLLAAAASAEKAYQFSFSFVDGSLLYSGVGIVEAASAGQGTGSFQLELRDVGGNVVAATRFEAPAYGPFTVLAAYHPLAAEAVVISPAQKEALRIPVLQFAGTCGNARCDEQESFETCASDCRSGRRDDYCDRQQDRRCDPDCKAADDADCEVQRQATQRQPPPQQFPPEQPVGEPPALRQENLPVSSGGGTSASRWWWIAIPLAALVIAMMAALFVGSRRTARLVRYVAGCRTQGYTELSIREALRSSGYRERQIERALRNAPEEQGNEKR